MKISRDKLRILLIYVALILATIIAYEPIRHNDFISYDDYAYVTENPQVRSGITLESVIWAFTTGHLANWHPLTWLSHTLDCELFELDPLWHHLNNLLLHIANTLLLFWVLKRMTGAVWPSSFVAAVFALHPLHVESVAWVAERKDVLSGLFWMLTMAAYIRYAERPAIGRYLLVVLAFGLGLMAKPMIVTLPFVLLLLDYWPLGRFQSRPKSDGKAPGEGSYDRGRLRRAPSKSSKVNYQRSTVFHLTIEKIPLFVLVVASSVATIIAQRSAGAVLPAERLAMRFRIANALVSYVRYVGKMIYPSKLAIFYPHPADRLPLWQPIVCFIILTVVSVGIICTVKRRRYLAVGWLWYLGTLVPVIGLIQVGSQAVADRYTYLPSIGIFAMVAWGAAELLGKWRYRKICLGTAAGFLLVVLSICTRTQVKYWKNNLILFKRVLAVTENNGIMQNSYGCALFEDGQLNKATKHLEEAVLISPRFSLARSNLGKVYLKQKRFNEAIFCFNEVLRVRKDWPDVYYFLGRSYAGLGKSDLAISNYYEALRVKSDYPEAHYRLGLAMTEEGNYDAAINHFNEALRRKPDWFDVRDRLALIYLQLGKYNQVITVWTEMLKLEPDAAEVHNNLAWVLATVEDAKIQNPLRAIEFAERACELTHYKDPGFLDTLAAAYAAAGRFAQATEVAEKAVRLAEAEGKKDMAEEIRKRLQLYRAGQPYREK